MFVAQKRLYNHAQTLKKKEGISVAMQHKTQ